MKTFQDGKIAHEGRNDVTKIPEDAGNPKATGKPEDSILAVKQLEL